MLPAKAGSSGLRFHLRRHPGRTAWVPFASSFASPSASYSKSWPPKFAVVQTGPISCERVRSKYQSRVPGCAAKTSPPVPIIADLWKLRDDNFAVQVVKHDHVPKETTKFLGKPHSKYEKKNWSSVMLFNNEKCKALTPDFVNTATGLELHRYQWLDGDHLIGDIPHRWNHLVGYDETVPAGEVSNLHYTIGGPYFDDYKDTDYAAEWFAEKAAMLRCDQKK